MRNHRAVLIVAFLLTIIAAAIASQLRIDTDLRQLLPAEHPIIKSLDEVEQNYGALGSINLVLQGGTQEQRHAFAERVADSLEGHPLLSRIEYRLPTEYFERKALYYLSNQEFETLKQRVAGWQHFELCTAQPSVCLEPPNPSARRALREFVESMQAKGQKRGQLATGPYFEHLELEAQVVLLHPVGPSSDLNFAREVSQAIRKEVDTIYSSGQATRRFSSKATGDQSSALDRSTPWKQATPTGSMRYNLVGPYTAKSDEQTAIRRDMLVSGTFGVCGVLLVILLVFRSFSAVFVLLVPLLAGVTWSLATTQLLLGHLNSMTSLMTTVVMGLGIDAGIHFLSHARSERRHHDDREAIRRAFLGVIAPLIVATTTTLGCFLLMATSDFPAFYEFGLIAASGVLLCLLAMVTVCPALLCTTGIKPARRRSDEDSTLSYALWVSRNPGKVLVLVFALSAISLPGVMRMLDSGFEYNGRLLQSASGRAQSESDVFLISKIFGKDVHAGILSVDGYEKMAEIYASAKAEHQKRVEREESVVMELVALPEVLPSDSIDAKQRRRDLRELSQSFTDSMWLRLQGGGELLALDQVIRDDAAARAEDSAGQRVSTQGVGQGPGERREQGQDSAQNLPEEDEFEEVEVVRPPVPSPDDGSTNAEEGSATEGDGFDFEEVEVELPPSPRAHRNRAESDESNKDRDTASNHETPLAVTKGADSVGNDQDLSSDKAVLTPVQVRSFRRMLGASPVQREKLPASILESFRGQQGSWAILAYPGFDAANIRESVRFIRETQNYGEAQAGQVYVGESTVYASMFLMMQQEWPQVMGTAVIVVFVIVWLQLGSLGSTLMTLLPLSIAMYWLFGLMGLVGVRLSLFNVPILPAILGIGVDNAVYFVSSLRRHSDGKSGVEMAVRETGTAIAAATSTTGVGFAALILSDSGGLRSIGNLAFLGTLIAAAGTLLVLPTLAALYRRRKNRD